MDNQVSGQGDDRWESPADEQREAVRGRVRGGAAYVSQGGGVKMKWVFAWVVASAIAIMALRHIDMVERFDQGLSREQEQNAARSDGDDFDKELDKTTTKKEKSYKNRESIPVAPPIVSPRDLSKYTKSY